MVAKAWNAGNFNPIQTKPKQENTQIASLQFNQPHTKNAGRLAWKLQNYFPHEEVAWDWLKNCFSVGWKIFSRTSLAIFPKEKRVKEIVLKVFHFRKILKALQVISHESQDWNKSTTICHISRLTRKKSDGGSEKTFFMFLPGERKKCHKFAAFFNVRSFLQETFSVWLRQTCLGEKL